MRYYPPVDREELRRRIAQRPNNVHFEELVALLEAYGWRLVRTTGSHHIFRRGNELFPVPWQKPQMKAVYVRKTLRLLEAAEHTDEEE